MIYKCHAYGCNECGEWAPCLEVSHNGYIFYEVTAMTLRMCNTCRKKVTPIDILDGVGWQNLIDYFALKQLPIPQEQFTRLHWERAM
jgi:hypothetical protein